MLICYFPLIVLYLAFMPRNIPLGALERKGLRGIFYLSSALAIAAAVEVLVLFPERSWSNIVGISFATVLTALTGISIVAAVAVLALRLVRSPEKSYERQQLTILFVFLTLAVLPIFFFVILPARLTIFVPFPFVYSLFALAPAGYFCLESSRPRDTRCPLRPDSNRNFLGAGNWHGLCHRNIFVECGVPRQR